MENIQEQSSDCVFQSHLNPNLGSSNKNVKMNKPFEEELAQPQSHYHQTQRLLFEVERDKVIYTNPVLSRPQYDLYSILETRFNIPSFEPITPNTFARTESSNVDDKTAPEKKKEASITTKTFENCVNSTELQKSKSSEDVASHGIDLINTPQQKQRRKRHRPRVIKEGKPKTPKSPTPAKTENPTGKRKYVRKKPIEKDPKSALEAAEQFSSEKQSPMKKTCRRELNFDEMDSDDEYSRCGNFTEYLDWQNKHHFSTRSVSKVTVQVCQGIEQTTVRSTRSNNTGSSPMESNISTSTVNQGDGFKGNYSHAMKQAYHFVSWQNNKKKRSDKGVNNVPSNAFFDAEKYFGAEAIEKGGGMVSEPIGQAQQGGSIVIDLTAYETPTKKRSRNTTRARDLSSLAVIAPQNREKFHHIEQPESCIDALKAQTGSTSARKKRTKKIYFSVGHHSSLQQYDRFPGFAELVNFTAGQYSSLQRSDHCPGYYQETEPTKILDFSMGQYASFPGNFREVKPTKMATIEDIERQLRCLDINKESGRFTFPTENGIVPFFTRRKENNELVLYKNHGMVLPFVPIKKSRLRAKVDLDEETDRVWKLLLENINSEGIDGTDEQKAKWWEDERSVFRGRADSFIAKMHLVQGDRRFSKWKGSVLDSVVGVFLTQNVSDHLSSSAFMSLAARYPVKSNILGKACIVIDESEVCVGENTPNRSVSGDSFAPRDVEIMIRDAEDNEISEITGTERNESLGSNATECCMEQEVAAISLISLQQCEACSTSQISDKTGSCSESNSDEGKPNSSVEISTSLLENMRVDGPTVPQEAYQGNGKMSSVTKPTETLLESSCCPRGPCNNTSSDKDTSVICESRSATNLERFEETTQDKPHHSDETSFVVNHIPKTHVEECVPSLSKDYGNTGASSSKPRSDRKGKDDRDWDQLRVEAEAGGRKQRSEDTMDSLDWEAVRCANVHDVADTIKERGMNNKLAERIQNFLNRLLIEHGSTDLEWLRDVPPDRAKEYLLSIRGLGLKSVECVRLLTLHHLAFPVDTNVGRIAVRLGWVPLQPLPESLQLHLLELYPVLETIQKYLWPRLCKLDQKTLYELHYQMITFGKVFCTKTKPNCNSCPMRGECRHFASAFASARLALPGPEEKNIVIATKSENKDVNFTSTSEKTPILLLPPAIEESKQEQHLADGTQPETATRIICCEPIIEEPATPEPECIIGDIEDLLREDPDDIPTIKLNFEEFNQNIQSFVQKNMELQDGEMSKALVALDPEAASIPMPKLKYINRLRTEHQVYELPDSHPLLETLQMEKRERDDPSPYLLAIWTPGETPNSIKPSEKECFTQALGQFCDDAECFSCNSVREANSQTVRGTILIPCRTAMRGSFPLNGTYFQVNEVFADNDSSLNPINVPREWLWKLQRRTVYFGTSIPSIFKGLTTQGIQHCFWRGYVCVRGFDQKSRAPRPLMARLHFPASRVKRSTDPKADK